MADSLFDKRYRYDYIYPRGRSGETLRAVDTEADDRPVVIKRPAPQDAPPIRAGQEASIRNEKRALQALHGHPHIVQLLGEGQFFVGGTPHQYIVMERAEGLIVADWVRELAQQGERLPLLEMLTIIDQLLDLLHAAHARDIVYNDVDAKHLFWSREAYRLRVIDWGNAVFLEGDISTPQGISRQTDVAQVGQLLYSLLTGGQRPDIPRDADASFALNFGDDARRVDSRLQAIISQAVHPNLRLRTASIAALRSDLTAFRAPLERERNLALARLSERLRRPDLNKDELLTLQNLIEPFLAQDPAHPSTLTAHREVVDRLRDLSVGADLDAAHIYIHNGHWERAQALLLELRERAGSQTSSLVHWLHDVCTLILENDSQATPSALQAIDLMMRGQPHQAAALLMADEPDDQARALHWLMAERISSHVGEVLLLRPNLYRLSSALAQLCAEGHDTAELQALLNSAQDDLDALAQAPLHLPALLDQARQMVETLQALNRQLTTFAYQHDQLPNRLLPLNAVERAINAAMALADCLHIIGRQASASPADAQNALETARQIDPPAPLWAKLEAFLQGLYARLSACQTYQPQHDGSDLQSWFPQARAGLGPYAQALNDNLLNEMLRALDEAEDAWEKYRRAVIEGDRETASETLFNAASALATISPSLSSWLRQLRVVVDGASYIERHSIPNPIGRALADGWEAFDRSRLAEAEQLGQQASEIARSEAERYAATRLQDLARLARTATERSGLADPQICDELLRRVESLLSADERRDMETFAAQMPSTETYLKAMSRGLVEGFARRSSAALRLLFAHYVLQSALSLYEDRMSDAQFWREAALRTLGEEAARHLLVRTLDDQRARLDDLNQANALLMTLDGSAALPHLSDAIRQLEANPQARSFGAVIQALRDLEVGLRDWQMAAFREAGARIESAIRSLNGGSASGLHIAPLLAWLNELLRAAAELSVLARELRGLVSQLPDQPSPRLEELHRDLVRLTTLQLGEDMAAQLRQWRETYDQFVAIYTSPERRSKRLERLDEFFKALFIDKHPAYALYRHWYGLLEQAPEFPAPPTDDPMPRMTPDVLPPLPDELPESAPAPRRAAPVPWRRALTTLGGLLVVATIALSALALLNSASTEPTPTQIAGATTQEPVPTLIPTLAHSPTPSPSSTPTLTPTSAPSATPSNTPTPTATFTPSRTPSVTPTTPPPTPTPLPPEGLQGQQDLIALIADAPDLAISPQVFSPLEEGGGYRLGTSEGGSQEDIRLLPPSDWFEARYGNNAASRLRSSSAEIALRTFNPVVVSSDQVYFGLALESAQTGDMIGLRVQVIGTNVINLYRVKNGALSFLSQRSVNAPIVRLRLERNPADGKVTLYYNDEMLGEAVDFLARDAELLPMVFVRGGGVIVGLSSWRVSLR